MTIPDKDDIAEYVTQLQMESLLHAYTLSTTYTTQEKENQTESKQ